MEWLQRQMMIGSQLDAVTTVSRIWLRGVFHGMSHHHAKRLMSTCQLHAVRPNCTGFSHSGHFTPKLSNLACASDTCSHMSSCIWMASICMQMLKWTLTLKAQNQIRNYDNVTSYNQSLYIQTTKSPTNTLALSVNYTLSLWQPPDQS